MMKEHFALIDQGCESLACWGRRRPASSASEYCFGSSANFILDVGLTFLDGKIGFHSVRQTEALIHRLDEFGPDVVHLHNIHGYYLNIDRLFKWLSISDCRVVWTLHDCWAFTGHCPYFTYADCNQWKSGCGTTKCPQLMGYPPTINSGSCKWNYEAKRSLFTSLPSDRLTIVTPSKWLAELVASSFLSKYPIEVAHNTIDLDIFRPRSNGEVSSVKEKYGLDSRNIILGVASPWSKRKGLSDFYTLADRLDRSKYSIVLVGLSAKQMRALPPEIVGIPRTDSQIELASLYSSPLFYSIQHTRITTLRSILRLRLVGCQSFVTMSADALRLCTGTIRNLLNVVTCRPPHYCWQNTRLCFKETYEFQYLF